MFSVFPKNPWRDAGEAGDNEAMTPPELPAAPPKVPRLRASTFCFDARRGVLAVRLRDPLSGHEATYLPGGGVEAGESPRDAAVRETLEETGYHVELVGDALVRRYDFLWNGKVHDCTTHFFVARLVDADAPPEPLAEDTNDAAYHCGVRWLAVASEADLAPHFGSHAAIHGEIRKLWRVATANISPRHGG
jgi:tRNA(adenine34) deaminase